MGQPYTMGDLGGEIVSGNKNGLGGPWRVLHVIKEATIDAITIIGVTDPDSGLIGDLPPGVYLFGQGITAYSQTNAGGLVYLAV